MRLFLTVALAVAVLASPVWAQDTRNSSDGRTPQNMLQQQGPFTGWNTLVVTTGASEADTLRPGFLSYGFDGIIFTYACSVGAYIDTVLVNQGIERAATADTLIYYDTDADSLWTGQAKRDVVTYRYVPAGSTVSWSLPFSGLIVKGLGAGTFEATFYGNP